MGLIDELVDKRNAIAHGRETAEDVGRGFSISEMNKRMTLTKRLCVHLARTAKEHCSKHRNFLR
jgi:hypothetical protein